MSSTTWRTRLGPHRGQRGCGQGRYSSSWQRYARCRACRGAEGFLIEFKRKYLKLVEEERRNLDEFQAMLDEYPESYRGNTLTAIFTGQNPPSLLSIPTEFSLKFQMQADLMSGLGSAAAAKALGTLVGALLLRHMTKAGAGQAASEEGAGPPSGKGRGEAQRGG